MLSVVNAPIQATVQVRFKFYGLRNFLTGTLLNVNFLTGTLLNRQMGHGKPGMSWNLSMGQESHGN